MYILSVLITTNVLFYCAVLQQAGRNPSWQTVNKYWTAQTASLNFDDFCLILKKESPVQKTELLKAFAKMDVNNDGYILHSELRNILTTVSVLVDN